MDFEDLQLMFTFEFLVTKKVQSKNNQSLSIDRHLKETVYWIKGYCFILEHETMLLSRISSKEPIAHISQTQKVFDYLGI